jgi:hypothetical protein
LHILQKFLLNYFAAEKIFDCMTIKGCFATPAFHSLIVRQVGCVDLY